MLIATNDGIALFTFAPSVLIVFIGATSDFWAQSGFTQKEEPADHPAG